jgi:hypothetical protein
MSDAARELLRELLEEALASANGNGDKTPQVPAAPVAAVLRPSTWRQPPAPGEVVGDRAGGEIPAAGAPAARGEIAAAGAPAASPAGVERVTIASDADLDRFVRALLARAATDGPAILAGRLRFTLGDSAGGVVRVDHGPVTERTVKKAAAAGARIVIGPGAVLTPLAREKARALGVEIEREQRC